MGEGLANTAVARVWGGERRGGTPPLSGREAEAARPRPLGGHVFLYVVVIITATFQLCRTLIKFLYTSSLQRKRMFSVRRRLLLEFSSEEEQTWED